MQKTINPFKAALCYFDTKIKEITGLTKPQFKFLSFLFGTWLTVPYRINFLNLFRYGGGNYCEKSIRNQFATKFPFAEVSCSLFEDYFKKENIVVFDPSFIKKSGKKTPSIGNYWSGVAQQSKKGLEISCLAFASVEDKTAYHIEAVQTPSATKGTLMEHYVSVIKKNIIAIKKFSNYIAVDAYFMKKSFIEPMLKLGLHVITKGRKDANFKYPFTGKQNKGRGRKKKFDKKVDLGNIDKRRAKAIMRNEDVIVYELLVHSVLLNRTIKLVYVEHLKTKNYEVLISTDITLPGEKILSYYRLRFQIEFLIRDAKQHTGLDSCEARSEEKLYNHFNMALTAVSNMKYQCWATLENKKEIPFSMSNIKRYHYNKFLTDSIFSNLELDLSLKKIKNLYLKCLELGNIAA